MTIDERLDRLTERHEALTQSVEMLTRDMHELRAIANDIAVGTTRLLRVVEAHEHRLDQHEERLDRLEGQ